MDKGPPTSSTITHTEALALYEKLVVLRRLETAASNMYKAKIIQGFCHLYLGKVITCLNEFLAPSFFNPDAKMVALNLVCAMVIVLADLVFNFHLILRYGFKIRFKMATEWKWRIMFLLLGRH